MSVPGSRLAWQAASVTESGEARKHRAQPVEQGKNDPNVGIRSQVQQLNCFQRRGRFGGLATGTAEPGQAVGPGAMEASAMPRKAARSARLSWSARVA